MNKDMFLRLQYLRMVNSEEFVAERWRSSTDRFIADMWDRTPGTPGTRFLAPVDPALGFSADNVEWQFSKIKPRKVRALRGKVTSVPDKSVRPTGAERKAARLAAAAVEKEARRKAIVEEFASWERRLNSG